MRRTAKISGPIKKTTGRNTFIISLVAFVLGGALMMSWTTEYKNGSAPKDKMASLNALQMGIGLDFVCEYLKQGKNLEALMQLFPDMRPDLPAMKKAFGVGSVSMADSKGNKCTVYLKDELITGTSFEVGQPRPNVEAKLANVH